MIVRIMGEGQYRVADDVAKRLDELDDEALAALEREDERELDLRLEEMAELVRRRGAPLPDEALAASDVVIPPTDLTLEETRKLFSDEGLVPELPA